MTDLSQKFEQLCADYCHHLDGGEAELWAALFTDDGSFVRRSKPLIEGREELRSFVADRPATSSFHLIMNSNIRRLPHDPADTYRGSATYVAADQNAHGSPEVVAVGVFRDTLRLVDGELRFSVRDVTRLG